MNIETFATFFLFCPFSCFLLYFSGRLQKGIDEKSIRTFYSLLSALIRPRNIEWTHDLNRTYEAVLDLGYTSESLMLELMQPCKNVARDCYWLNQRQNCDSLFRVIKTAEGFCCSFNYHAIKPTLER